jgi:GNAT superfamily N-acetyltransferase
MTNKLIIRRAKARNIATIKKLAESIWPSTYVDTLSPDQIEYMMELFYSETSLKEQFNRHTFLIAYLDGKPVGFASYSLISAEGNHKLHKLYVITPMQGRGLGKALINFIIDALKLLDGTTLELNVNRNNKATTFYERLGFEVIREEDIDIGNGYFMNDYVMRLTV